DTTVLSKPYKLSSSKVTGVKKYSTYSRIEVATADGTCTVLVDGKTKIKKGNTVDVYFVATNAQVEKSKVHVYGLAKAVTKSK
ncbi:MAG: hypothetical protein K6E95_07415, partial [Lachnospiraceae bacterium]|nr:hypothetical protein [Lachnospiraceae bacterium]